VEIQIFFYPPLQNSGFNTVFWLSSLLFALAFLQKEICCQGTSGGVDMEWPNEILFICLFMYFCQNK